jgi:hypothetical protein
MEGRTPEAAMTAENALDDDALLDRGQRQIHRYVWDLAHPGRGFARDCSYHRPEYAGCGRDRADCGAIVLSR